MSPESHAQAVDELADELHRVIAEDDEQNERPAFIKKVFGKQQPAPQQDNSSIVASVTNEDTGRATRTMHERMTSIVSGLERELAEANVIRINVLHRIEDLRLALDATRLAVETLKVKGNLK